MEGRIVFKAQEYLENIQKEMQYQPFVFHKLSHTDQILKAISKLGKEYLLSDEQIEMLEIAATFHYSGMHENYSEPLVESKKITQTFLDKQVFTEEKQQVVLELLGLTDDNLISDNVLHLVYLDSLTAHYSSKKFTKKASRWQDEWSYNREEISDLDWLQKCYSLLSKHQYHSAFAREKYSEGLEQNKAFFGKRLKSLSKQIDGRLEKDLKVDEEELKELKKKLKKIEGRPERGVETFFRLASKNLYTRAAMADNKSNIMISINAIVLSIILGTFYSKMDEDPHLIYAVVTLLLTNLISIGLAIIATRPSIEKKHHYSREDVQNQLATIMTFDDFRDMAKEDFEWAIDRVMNDADYLYLNITRDIYSLGQGLARKYKLLYYSYSVFLIGLTTAIMLFMICHLWF